MLTCIFMLALLMANASVFYSFDSMDYEIRSVGDYYTLKLNNGQTWGTPGEPELPWIGVKLLLPLKEEATDVIVRRSNPTTISLDRFITPLQQQYPLSQREIMPRNEPNSDIYGSDKAFPYNVSNGFRTEFLAGHPIAFTAVSPFEYNPVRGELTYYRSISVEVQTAPSTRAAEASRLLKQDSFISKYLMRSVDNQDQVPYYTHRTEGFEYIIVIDQAKVAQWTPLKDFYTDRGYSVLLKPIQEIYTSYTGVDNQDKIRNYFIDMYTNNSLRYALLAGDTDVIPHRGLYVNFAQGGQMDADIPADMYYSCLDGNWNNNGNSYWGELYEADLAPEFAIGRFCYNSDTEISNFINKVMMYQIAPVESTIKSSAFVGEYLWDGPTWGGDYMDEMIGGTSMHGYTTVGVPTSWNTPTLYDRTYGYENGWGGTQIRALLSAGHNLVNHLGHSATTYNMRLSNNGVTANTITNNGSTQNYSIYFTQGCYAGAFDNRDTNVGQYVGDCITEKFTSIATSAAGMISHSRYGWGMQGSTNGASQYFHRQYIDAIFGESINELGYTLVDSKIDNIPFISNSPVMYWVTYETNLIGDPLMMIWSDTPQLITAQLPSLWAYGVNSYQIQTNAPNATLRILSGGNLVFETTSNSTGLFSINLLQSLTPGNYSLFINAPNFYSYQTNILVEVSEMPYIVCNAIEIEHDSDLLEAGDIISMSFNIENVGTVNLTEPGTLILSSTSSHVTILQNTISFDPVNAGSSNSVDNAFSLRLNYNYTDGAVVPLTLTANYQTYSTTSSSTITLNAPTLSISNYQVHNVANLILPGHSPQISFSVQNSGTGYAYSPMLILMPNDPNITVNTYEIDVPQVEPDGTVNVPYAFTVNVSPNAGIGSTASIGYYLTGENGSGQEGVFTFHIGMMVYTFENDMQNWTSEAPNTQFTNQWHRNNARNYTDDGSFSVKFGGAGTGQYANSAYGALISPEIALGLNSQLHFHHWMDAEIHTTAGMCWDGGMVQISVNGGAWTQITPVGGYPYRIYTNPASPFPANTYVYSGTHDWQEAIFDLSEYSGTARIRFLFGTDGAVTGEGWYIDDVRVDSEIVSLDDFVMLPQVYSLSNHPNPFNPTTSIKFTTPTNTSVGLIIYNLKGQKVRTLISDKDYAPGTHTVIWDGKDDTGSNASSGVYFYKLITPARSITNKMLLLK